MKIVPMIYRRILSSKGFASFLMLFSIGLFVYLIAPVFLSPDNVRVILWVLPELGIVVIGVTMLMISGEFDLSVGSVFAFCPVVTFILIRLGWNIWLVTILTLLACCMIGAFHAIVTLRIGIPSFITTLGGMMLWRGVTLVFTKGFPPPFPQEAFTLKKVLAGTIGGSIPLPLVYFGVIVLIFWVILERTKFGNWVFATGGNPKAASSRGINVKKVKFVNFVLVSLLAGFSGLIQACRITAALPIAGTGLELNAIASSVVGGTLLTGGTGSIIGSAIGALMIRAIGNALIAIGIPGYWFRVSVGVLIIVAVILNNFFGRLRG